MKKKEKIEILNLKELKSQHGGMNHFDIYVEKHYCHEYPEHTHAYCEVELVEYGEGVCVIDGKTLNVKQGDIIFTRSGAIHGWKNINGKIMHIITVAFDFKIFLGKFDLFDFDNIVVKGNSDIYRMFQLLLEERENNDEYTKRVQYNIVECILIYLTRKTGAIKDGKKETNIEYVLGYIHENFMLNLTLEEVSKQCNYSISHFSKKFKSVTGKTFIEYLNDVRLNYAVNILSNSNVRITELAYDCGFGSVRSFNREFKKKYGCSPNEYKKK